MRAGVLGQQPPLSHLWWTVSDAPVFVEKHWMRHFLSLLHGNVFFFYFRGMFLHSENSLSLFPNYCFIVSQQKGMGVLWKAVREIRTLRGISNIDNVSVCNNMILNSKNSWKLSEPKVERRSSKKTKDNLIRSNYCAWVYILHCTMSRVSE